jgi:type III pantothenate kinase
MDINLLALGVGNSRLALGVFMAGELRQSARVPVGDKSQLADALAKAWPEDADGWVVVGATVNPQFNTQIEQAVLEVTDQSIRWVGPDINIPIGVETENPAATGIDRLLNVAAAYEQMEKACIVVDAGTAVTVDCCNDNGDFLGGAIMPGVQMMLDALAEKTAGIGKVEFTPPAAPYGNSTASAVSQGIYHGIRGLVREFAESFATTLGAWPEIIATGGDAAALFEGWELIHAIAPDLNLYGIALAYADHNIRHGT